MFPSANLLEATFVGFGFILFGLVGLFCMALVKRRHPHG
jgi:hypothetical protein